MVPLPPLVQETATPPARRGQQRFSAAIVHRWNCIRGVLIIQAFLFRVCGETCPGGFQTDSAVTFSITAGGGMLSSTTATTDDPCTIESSTSVATAITDANGRAATRLTLGRDPGTNTVEATVTGLDPETFTATATEQATPHSLTLRR